MIHAIPLTPDMEIPAEVLSYAKRYQGFAIAPKPSELPMPSKILSIYNDKNYKNDKNNDNDSDNDNHKDTAAHCMSANSSSNTLESLD